MRRRSFLLAIPLVSGAIARPGKDSLHGKLRQQPGAKPALQTAEGKLVFLEGDAPTSGVLNDPRLANAELEVIGRQAVPDRFVIDPIHTKSMFVLKDGRRLFITYWCAVCSIRTYTPGLCWCCQQETELDLRESIEP